MQSSRSECVPHFSREMKEWGLKKVGKLKQIC
jgi:hypothetical protein